MNKKLKIAGSYLLEAWIFMFWIIFLPLTGLGELVCFSLEKWAHKVQDWRLEALK